MWIKHNSILFFHRPNKVTTSCFCMLFQVLSLFLVSKVCTGGPRYMQSFYLQICVYGIKKWPFSWTYPLINNDCWSFYMQIHYMRAYFWSPFLAYNEVHLVLQNSMQKKRMWQHIFFRPLNSIMFTIITLRNKCSVNQDVWRHIIVTRCHKNVTKMSQKCHKNVTKMSQQFFLLESKPLTSIFCSNNNNNSNNTIVYVKKVS